MKPSSVPQKVEDTQKVEVEVEVKVQVLPYMGKPKDKKSSKYPAITSGAYTKRPSIQKERDDYEL